MTIAATAQRSEGRLEAALALRCQHAAPAAIFLASAVVGVASAGSHELGSGLHGHVREGPIMPVCREDQSCYERAAHADLVFRRHGRIAARTKTRADGSYRIALRPGRYRVRTAHRVGVGIDPSVVRVPRHGSLRVDFSIDTGIQ